MWVPLPDVIICARFYLYRPHSFLGADPQKLAVPIDLKGDLYNSCDTSSGVIVNIIIIINSAKQLGLSIQIMSNSIKGSWSGFSLLNNSCNPLQDEGL